MIPLRQRVSATASLATFALVALAGCNKEQRSTIDSAAGTAASAVRAALSVIDIDMGRRIDAEKKVIDHTEIFAPTDSIFASVHTSGTAASGAVTGRWTGPGGAVVNETTNQVTTSGDAHTAFLIVRPSGLPKGTYTLHVIIDGKEVRTKDFVVQ